VGRVSTARPTWCTPRRTSRPTWGPRVAKVGQVLRQPLMPWQLALAEQALECDDHGRLIYREVRVTVPRQSGKSTLILAKNIQRMIDAKHFGGRQNLLYTAQTRKAAKKKLMDGWVEDLRAIPRFHGRWRERRTIGEESIRWENGSIWSIEANTETAGHGDTLDAGDIDEAFAQLDDRIEQAMEPAMMTRPCAQLWIVSTAGTERSIYLKGKVDSGRAMVEAGLDEGVLYVEYSADPDADPEDPETWWSCMPALGYTVTEDVVRQALQKARADQETGGGMGKFCRAYLNLWMPSTYSQQVIPAADWAAVTDPHSQISGDWVVWCLDVSPGSATAAIAVAGPRSDGLAHGEVVDYREGDGWAVPRLVELQGRWGPRPLVIDPAGPAGALLPKLRAAGIVEHTKDHPDGLLYLMSGRDMAQACGALKSGAQALDADAVRTWRHPGQQALDDALAGAAKRTLLDSWAWTRTSSSADICPLVALTGALWGLSTIPRTVDVPLVAWR
jgi:hypothetical protein